MKYFLAVDIGASSGRHIVGWNDGGKLATDEVYRFKNGVVSVDGALCWDIDSIFNEVVNGIKAALAKYPQIESMSIDTWAVDYMLLKNDEPIYPCCAYRDERTAEAIKAVHNIIPFEQLYSRTGIQFQPFNTVYQLYADKISGKINGATDFLMIPEYLIWRLTGGKIKEYTNATSTGLVNAESGEFDGEIIDKLGLPKELFGKVYPPKTKVGAFLPEIAKRVGGSIDVVLCPTHDTASAVEGIPMSDDSPFLSSGTWSLLGAKIAKPITNDDSRKANFTNEGGVGYIRYLKNIMGLWIVQCLQKQMNISFGEMVELAKTSSYDKLFDVNAERFRAPEDMRAEIADELGGKLTDADILNSVYRSLGYSYSVAVNELESLVGKRYDRLYIAGGGAKNTYLNELTAQFTNKQVIALPIEATALGNLKTQMQAAGEFAAEIYSLEV